MRILEIKTITIECIDYVTNEKSIFVEKNWKVEYKGKKYNRFLTENSVRWDDPNYDRIKALMMVSNPSYT